MNRCILTHVNSETLIAFSIFFKTSQKGINVIFVNFVIVLGVL